jgi:hypothetical protein
MQMSPNLKSFIFFVLLLSFACANKINSSKSLENSRVLTEQSGNYPACTTHYVDVDGRNLTRKFACPSGKEAVFDLKQIFMSWVQENGTKVLKQRTLVSCC